jgi:hypothetical protein
MIIIKVTDTANADGSVTRVSTTENPNGDVVAITHTYTDNEYVLALAQIQVKMDELNAQLAELQNQQTAGATVLATAQTNKLSKIGG